MEIPYRPSYATLRTPPRNAPAETGRAEQAPSPIVLPLGPELKTANAAPPPPAAATSVRLSGSLAGRSLVQGGTLALHASEPLRPARFLIGLSAKGEARFSFLQDSSGDDAADRAAASWLASAAFSPGEPAIAWGTATIEWGSDAYAPAEAKK
jgi:hypothetical protein